MNNCTFAGRLGRDAETRHTSGGQSVTSFALAVDEYAGKGERRTQWIECALWGERGEKLAAYLTKGSPVVVSGQASARAFESKGETRASLSLRVQEVTLLGGKQDRQDAPRQPRASGTGPVEHASDGFDGQDIPF